MGFDLIEEKKFEIVPDPVVLLTQKSMEIDDNRVVWRWLPATYLALVG